MRLQKQQQPPPPLLIEVLTFTEHKVGGDVERLDLDVIHGHGDALLVVTGNESKGLLRLAHKRAPSRSHEG